VDEFKQLQSRIHDQLSQAHTYIKTVEYKKPILSWTDLIEEIQKLNKNTVKKFKKYK